MISIQVQGHPVAVPPLRIMNSLTLYGLTYDGWRERVRRAAVFQLGYGREKLSGILVVAVRLKSVVWEQERVDRLVHGVLDALVGLAYDDVNQIGKLLVEKVPADPDRGEDEGAFISIWTAEEYEAAFADAMAALFEELGQEGESHGRSGRADAEPAGRHADPE